MRTLRGSSFLSPHPNMQTPELPLVHPRLRAAALLLFALALLVITLLALLPKPPAAADLGWDKLNHFSAFVALGLLARAAWPAQTWARWTGWLMLYGGLLEIAQGLTPNRQAEWSDWLADGLGLLLAALLWALLWALRSAWQRRQQLRQAVAQAD